MSEPGTPLPWARHVTFKNQILSGGDRYDTGGECVAVTSGGDEDQNAAYIVEACNAYPQLRDVIRKLVEQAKYAQALLEEDYQPGIIAGLPTAIAEAERLLNESEGE